MVRKSTRLPGGAVSNSAHKRVASATAAPSEHSKRTKVQKATPTKSQYFQGQDQGNATDEVKQEGTTEESSDDEDAASAFEEFSGQSEASDLDEDDDNESSDSAEESTRRSSSSRKVSKAAGTVRQKAGSKTGLGPGTQVVIKKPKPRPAGSTPYLDDTVHPNTLLFLTDLKANNRREWLKLNDSDFRASERDWHSFVETLSEKLSEVDDTIPELPIKDIIFRIYRDVRFSSDPTPYKPYFSAAWSRTGRKGPYAHYYVQVSPNESFVGGGLWHPDARRTALMRQVIDQQPDRIKRVLLADGVRREFLKGAPKQEDKVVEAFVASNAENALKTKPKGFDSSHKDLDLLRLRNYTLGRGLADQELLGPSGLARIVELFRVLKPFVTLLNSIVMPDAEHEDDGSEHEGGSTTGDDSGLEG